MFILNLMKLWNSILGPILLGIILIITSTLFLWLVSKIMGLPRKDFITAFLTSLVIWSFSTVIGLIYKITLLVFNIKPTIFFALIMALAMIVIQIIIAIFAIERFYETTKWKAFWAYIIHYLFIFAISVLFWTFIGFVIMLSVKPLVN